MQGAEPYDFNISKRKLIDELILKKGYYRKFRVSGILKRVWDLDNMPSTDGRFKKQLKTYGSIV